MRNNQERFLLIGEPPVPAVEARWRHLLESCEFVTHYATPEFFAEPEPNRKFALLCRAGEDTLAVATGIIEHGKILCGNVDRPQVTIASAADREAAAQALAQGLKALARQSGAKLAQIVSWDPLPRLKGMGFSEQIRTGVVLLDLSRGPDALLREFSSNKRINIKKAKKFGLVVAQTTDPDDVAAYHSVHVDWAHRKGLPVEDLKLLQARVALTRNRRLFVARHDGKVVAGVVVRFAPGGVVEYAANASREESLHLRPNDILHWHVIEWACAEGFRTYSLAGSHMFLRKFGGALHPTYRYRLDRTILRRYAIADIAAHVRERIRLLIPARILDRLRQLRDKGRSLGEAANPP